jgi:hypothetical protein
MIRQWFYIPLFCLLWTCPTSTAQTLYLSEKATGATRVKAEVGDIIEIEVQADLGRFSATGVSFFINIPHGTFQVIDSSVEARPGIQPFVQGPLFEGGMEAGNALVAKEHMPNMLRDQQMLQYSIILGPGTDRGRRGSGVVALLKLRCNQPALHCEIGIASSPIHETRLVLDDGYTERRFLSMQGMEVTAETPSTLVKEKDTWGQIKAHFKILYEN